MKTAIRCALFGAAAFLPMAVPFGALAQGAPVPIKPGLWETQSTVTNTMAMPPEVVARMAAMPPAQQAQMRAMMPGPGGKPTTVTIKSCVASQMNLDSFLNQQQQRSGMKCTFNNRVHTASVVSFDTTCTLTQGTGSGHTEIHLIDDQHVTSSTHMTIDATSNGHSTHSTMESTGSTKYLSADCGDVKPFAPPAAH